MSLKAEDIYNFLNNWSPLNIQESQDNSGLQIGDLNAEVKGILLCVDVTQKAIEFAKKHELNLIISHHPLIFNPLYKISKQDPFGNLIFQIIKANITVFSWHTPLDKVKDGVSEAILNKIGYKGIDFVIKTELNGEIFGLGRVVYLEKSIKLQELVNKIKKAFNSWVMLVGEEETQISNFAVCGGSGSFLIKELKKLQVNTLITSDVKYHLAKECEVSGFNLILIDHAVGESAVLEVLETKLSEFVKDTNIPIKTFYEKSPYKIL